MKLMNEYIYKHIDILANYCKQVEISLDKVLRSPKCFNDKEMYIQRVDEAKTGEGLKNNVPAEILLIIRKDKDLGLTFQSFQNIKKYLS